MTSITTGLGLGLFNTSNNLLGTGGGNPTLGRTGQNDRVYVNGKTGNLVIQQTDEILANSGLNLALVRTYNSQGLLNDDNGDNWRLNIAVVSGLSGTLNSGSSTVKKTFGDGSVITYTYDTNLLKYVSKDGDGAHDSLINVNGIWTWTDGSGRNTETYNSSGQLTASKNIDGTTTTYTYNATTGLLTQIKTLTQDATGSTTSATVTQTTTLTYSGNNLTQISVAEVNGTTTTQTRIRYTYDTSNRLSQVQVDLTPGDNSIADGKVYKTTYTYDGTSKRVASITETDGSSVSFTYDTSFRIKTITDGAGKVTTFTYASTTQTDITDPLGNITTYKTDTAGRLIEVDAPTVGGARTTTAYTYDTDGNVTQIIQGSSTEVATYLSNGTVGKSIQFTVMQYDTSGNLLLTRDALGNTVTRTYDTNNNQLITETAYLTPDPDGSGTAQPMNPVTTRYAYDGENHLRYIISAQGHVTEYRYNTLGNRTSQIQYTGNAYTVSGLTSTTALTEAQLNPWVSNSTTDKTKAIKTDYAYDFRGQLQTATTYDSLDTNGNGIVNANTAIQRYVYDQRGYLLQTVDGRGTATNPTQANTTNATTYTYDGLGRLLTSTQWVSGTDALRTSTTVYDDTNKQVRTTVTNGLITTQTYDTAGHLLSITQSTSSQTFGTISYKYDADGRLRQTTDPTGVKTYIIYDEASRKIADIDGVGAMTEYVYNANNQVAKTIRYADPLTPAQLTSLADASGNPANFTSANFYTLRPVTNSASNQNTFYLYDKANHLVLTIVPNENNATQGYATQNFYDGAGRLVDVIQYYNPVTTNTLTASSIPSDVTITVNTTNDRHVRSFYDSDNKLQGSLDAEGYLTEYQYDNAGELTHTIRYAKFTNSATRYTDSFTTTKNNITGQSSATQGIDPNDQHSYLFYNSKGQVSGVLDAENYLTTYDYDQAGNKLQETRYYDKAPVYTTQTLTQLKPTTNTALNHITVYAYNGANQVTTVTTNPQGIITQYSYNNVGQLTQTTTAPNTSDVRTTQARYDVRGNLLQELTGEGSAALAAQVNPTQTQINDVWNQYSLTHTYDNANRRISTTDQNGYKTLFFYDNANRLTYTVNVLGEVSQSVYNALGQMVDTIRYSKRLTTADLSSLTGGLVTPTLTAKVTAIANATGTNPDNHSHYNYTLRGAVKDAIDGYGTSIASTTSYTYNEFGQVKTQVNPVSASQSYTYNLRGLRLSAIQGSRNQSYTYDAFGRVSSIKDSYGTPQSFTYDRLGRTVTTTTAYGTSLAATVIQTYDAFGRVLTQSDARNSNDVTRYTYNDGAKSLTILTPEGISTVTTYNAYGQTVSVTDGNLHVATYVYDKNGNLTSVTTANGELNLTTSNSYDHANRKFTTTDANGTVTQFDYDAANRLLLRTVDPTGLALTTSYSYDGQGRVLTTTDGNGTVTLTQYDAKGQVTQVIVDPQSYIDSNGNTVSKPADQAAGLNLTTLYTYDNEGHTLTVTQKNIVNGLNQDRVTQYVYDNLGRRVQEIKDPSNTATGYVGLNITTVYSYDNNDNLVAKTEGQGTTEARTTRYVYDIRNRLTDTVDAMGGVTHNDYDANNNVIKTTEYANPISLTGLGNAITAIDISSRLTLNNTTDRTTQYAYDKNNRLVYIRDSLNQLTQRIYDKNNNVIQVTAYATAIASITANTKDAYDNAVAAVGFIKPTLDHIQRSVYDAANRAVFNLDSLNQVIETRYDKAGHATATTAYATAIALPATITETAIRSAVTAIASSANDRTTLAVYDGAGRLHYSVDALGYVKKKTYDGVGNVRENATYVTGLNIAAVLSAAGYTAAQLSGMTADQMRAALPAALNETTIGAGLVSDAGNDQKTQYDYDAAGRLETTMDIYGNTESYQYDQLGNKIAYTNKKGDTWTYLYDVLGRLTQETTPNIDVTRIQTNANGNPLLDANGQVITNLSSEAVITRITYDALGNVKTRIEAYGAPEQRITTYLYDALGRQTQTIFPPASIYNAAADNLVTSTSVTITQSSNVINNAWKRDTTSNTLVSVPGMSIDISQYKKTDGTPMYYDDTTPTSVKATVYRSDGTLVGTSTTDVGTFAADSYGVLYWVPVNGWNGQVNLSATAFVTDNYRVELEISRDEQTQGGMPATPVWTHTGTVFMSIGLMDSSVLPRVETTQILSSAVNYDRFGNATINKDVSGNYSYKVYDQLGRLQYEIDAKRYVTEYSYDTFGNQITLTRYAQAIDFAATTANFAAHTDLSKPLIASEVAERLALQTSAQHASDRTITNFYDALNRVIETKQPAVYSYDASSTTNPYFTASPTTRNEYNVFGQLVRQRTLINPNNSTDSTLWTWADGYLYYDRGGHKVAEINALGYITGYQYDALGNLTQQTEYAAALTAGSWNTKTTLNYVSGQKLVSYTTLIGTTATTFAIVATTPTDGNSQSSFGFDRITKYIYDRLNRKTQEIKVGVQYALPTNSVNTAPNMTLGDLTSKFGYDAMGNLISVTDAQGATVYSYFDALGRSKAIAEPARLSENSAGMQMPSMHALNQELSPTVIKNTFAISWHNDTYRKCNYQTTYNLTTTWPSLANLGEGDVEVTFDYVLRDRWYSTYYNSYSYGSTSIKSHTQSFSAAKSSTGVTMTWNELPPDINSCPDIVSINHVRVTKVVNGKVMVLFDSADGAKESLVYVSKPPVVSSITTLKIRLLGSTSWTTLPPTALIDRGDFVAFDFKALSPALLLGQQYEYQVSYAANDNPSVAYYTGEGSFTVPDATSAFVDERALQATIISGTAANNYSNSIVLGWPGLSDWGAGDVRATVNYTYKTSPATATISGTQTKTVSAAEGLAGSTFTISGGALLVMQSITSVKVEKQINGVWLTIYDQPGSGNLPNRLVLQGDTTNVTGIVIDGQAGPFPTASVIGNALAVDISGLKRGTYTYHLIRNNVTETITRRFEVKTGISPSAPLVQEIFGYEDTSGKFVKRIEIVGLPTNAASLIFTYRLQGDTGPYLSKTTTATTTPGLFFFNYDEIKNGLYEYILKDTAGNTFANGTGTFAIKRGVQDVAHQAGAAQAWLTPLTTYARDIFGNVVDQAKFANGATSVSEDIYKLPVANKDDQHRYTQYDSYGHVLRTIDAEGKSTFYSYNAAGQVAKSWQPQTDASGIGHYVVHQYSYDALGQQVNTTEVLQDLTLLTLHQQDSTVTSSFTSVQNVYGKFSYGWLYIRTDTVNLTWPSMASWGDGDVKVRVDFTRSDGSVGYNEQTFSAASTVSGATLSWATNTINVGSAAITQLNHITVSRIVDGQQAVVFDQAASTGPSRQVLWQKPSVPNTLVTIGVRPSGSTGAYTNLNVVVRGDYLAADISALSAGVYQYQLTYSLPDTGVYYTYTAESSLDIKNVSALGLSTSRIEVEYGAFGSIVKKGTNGGWQEYFDYDAGGRLWRSNQDDGVAKVYLYNLAGQNSAEIRSQGRNLGDRVAYANASTVAVLTSDVERSNTAYDILGRAKRQEQAAFVNIDVPNSKSLTVTAQYLDLVGTTSAQMGVFPNISIWTGTSSINLKWSSLEDWGNGDVKVIVDYIASNASGATTTASRSQTLSAMEGMTGTTLSWSASVPSNGNEYVQVQSVSRIRVYKTIDGVDTLVQDSSVGDQLQTATLSWQKSPVEPSQVELYYRVANTSQSSTQWNTTDGSWTKLTLTAGIESRGSRYWANVSSLPAGQYNYVLVYKYPTDTQAYSQGTGTFVVATTTALGSTQIAGFVEEPSLDLSTTSSAQFINDGNSISWKGTSSINLKWSSLDEWGSGNVKITVDYVASNGNGATTTTSRSQTLNAIDGMTGTTLTWSATNPSNASEYAGLQSISRIRVYKTVDGVDVLVHDSTVGDRIQPERLILRGSTANLTGVEIRDEAGTTLIDTRSLANGKVTLLGSGVYAVDVSDLARGRYNFTAMINGAVVAYRQGFEVYGSGTGNKPVIQEDAVYLDLTTTSAQYFDDGYVSSWMGTSNINLKWSSLKEWGSGNVKITVDYVASNGYGNTTIASRSQTLNAMDGMTGTTLSWSASNLGDLNEYAGLQSVSRIRVWKVVDGVDVLVQDTTGDVYAPRLELSNLPSTANTVTLEYRKLGSDTYLSKLTTKIGTGWFTANYDDIPIGVYEYRLTVKDASNNAIDLTSVGGNAQGQISGTIKLKRGGQDIPNIVTASASAPVLTQTFDRWGNVLSSLDPRNSAWATLYRYNYNNQAIEKLQPQVMIKGEDGSEKYAQPKMTYGYDLMGRQISVTDANNNTNGSHYDAAGQLITESHADGALVRYVYDAFGRQTAVVDGAVNRSELTYDRQNRLTQRRDATGAVESYTYDELGHRITVTDGVLNTTLFYYDLRGNLIKTRLPGTQESYVRYDMWGHKTREARSGTTDYSSWTYDYFGKLIGHTDLGGATYSYTYDNDNHLRVQTNSRGQNLTYSYYENGELKSIADRGAATGNLAATNSDTWYAYDALGHHTREVYRVYDSVSKTYVTYQDAVIIYDALGRMTSYTDTNANTKYEYDAVGNKRHTMANFTDASGAGSRDYWYTYDAMNRILISEGTLINGAFVGVPLNGHVGLAETSYENGFTDTFTWSGLTGLGSDPARQQFVDINGDGKVDWVSFPTAGGVEVHLYQQSTDGVSGFNATPSFIGLVNVGSDPSRIRLVDVNGDGKLDLLYFPTSGGMWIYLNDLNGGFSATPIFTGFVSLGSDPLYFEFADINKDNVADLVYFPSGGGVQVYLNDGTGKFNTTAAFNGLTNIVGKGGGSIKQVALADVNNDGRVDLVYFPFSGTRGAQVYLNNGANGFNTTATWSGLSSLGYIAGRSKLVDMNGDGKIALVFYPGSGGIQVYLANGTGGFSSTAAFSGLTSVDSDPTRFVLKDTNNDRKLDLIHIMSAGGAEIFLNNGQGGFNTTAVWSGLKDLGSEVARQKFVDLNGDGYLDWINVSSTGGAKIYMHGKTHGIALEYDGGGNRRKASYFDAGGGRVTDWYTFDGANRLLNTYRLDTATQLRSYTSERLYDAAGRVAVYKTYTTPGVLSGRSVNTYNENGWLFTRQQYDKNNTLSYTVDYSASGSYASDGRTQSYKIIGTGYTNTYTTSYRAFESYKQDKELGNSTYFLSGKTNFSYDVDGNLIKVTDVNDSTKYRTFLNSLMGEFLVKTDNTGKKQFYYYANGAPIGSHGALVDADFDYNYTPVSDDYPASTPGQYVANEGDTLQRVALSVYGDAKLWYLIADANGLTGTSTLTAGQVLTIPNRITNLYNDANTLSLYNPGLIIGSTVPRTPPPPPPKIKNEARMGLAIVSASAFLFGGGPLPGQLEAAVWHYSKIDDNDGREFLAEVHNVIGDHRKAYWIRHEASNNQVRNTAIIFAVVVAAIITYFTWGIGSGAGAVLIAMAGAIGSSLASQTILIGSGVQQNYNWGAVATSALTAGIGASGALSSVSGGISGALHITSEAGQAAVSMMVTNAVSQGVSMLTGQQKKFDWASVAAAGLTAGLLSIGSSPSSGVDIPPWQSIVGSIAGTLTGKLLNMVVEHNGWPQWASVMADGFGNALGNALVNQIASSMQSTPNQQAYDPNSEYDSDGNWINPEMYNDPWGPEHWRSQQYGTPQEPISAADAYFLQGNEPGTTYPLPEEPPIVGVPLGPDATIIHDSGTGVMDDILEEGKSLLRSIYRNRDVRDPNQPSTGGVRGQIESNSVNSIAGNGEWSMWNLLGISDANAQGLTGSKSINSSSPVQDAERKSFYDMFNKDFLSNFQETNPIEHAIFKEYAGKIDVTLWSDTRYEELAWRGFASYADQRAGQLLMNGATDLVSSVYELDGSGVLDRVPVIGPILQFISAYEVVSDTEKMGQVLNELIDIRAKGPQVMNQDLFKIVYQREYDPKLNGLKLGN